MLDLRIGLDACLQSALLRLEILSQRRVLLLRRRPGLGLCLRLLHLGLDLRQSLRFALRPLGAGPKESPGILAPRASFHVHHTWLPILDLNLELVEGFAPDHSRLPPSPPCANPSTNYTLPLKPGTPSVDPEDKLP